MNWKNKTKATVSVWISWVCSLCEVNFKQGKNVFMFPVFVTSLFSEAGQHCNIWWHLHPEIDFFFLLEIGHKLIIAWLHQNKDQKSVGLCILILFDATRSMAVQL